MSTISADTAVDIAASVAFVEATFAFAGATFSADDDVIDGDVDDEVIDGNVDDDVIDGNVDDEVVDGNVDDDMIDGNVDGDSIDGNFDGATDAHISAHTTLADDSVTQPSPSIIFLFRWNARSSMTVGIDVMTACDESMIDSESHWHDDE